MKKFLLATALLAFAGTAVQAQEFDDIYYNPKKDSSQSVEKKSKKKKSNYIKDFSSIDVDTYNRRGQYYESPIDTIGVQAEEGEDFVYTQKIQKFYNPTVVVDNADILAEVIDNSYGNIDIIFENGLPYFNSIYGWPGYYNYYSWVPSWRWNSPFYWSYSPVWGYEYWPSWSLGPSWAWGPSLSWNWGWNYGPSWGWGPAWGPSYGWGSWGRPFYADYAPGGRLPNRPGSNWANNTRPGGNIGRPVGNRPGYSASHSSTAQRPASTNHHRTYSFGNSSVPNRADGQATVNRQTYSVGADGHRRYGTTTTGTNNTVGTGSHRGSSTTTNRTTTYNNNRSNSTNSNRSSSSYNYNSGSSSRGSSYSTGRSSSAGRAGGGSYGGGGRSSGGSGRGRR